MIKKLFDKVRGLSAMELVTIVVIAAIAAGGLIYMTTSPQYLGKQSSSATTDITSAEAASPNQATATNECYFGQRNFLNLFTYQLQGKKVMCGNSYVCVSQTMMDSLPYLPNLFIDNTLVIPAQADQMTQSVYRAIYDKLAPGIKAYLTFKIGQISNYHYGAPAPVSLADMPMPSFYSNETEFAGLNSKTYKVEFVVPASYLNPNPQVTPASNSDTIKLRGWYIKGDGVSGKSPLIIWTPGIGSVIGSKIGILGSYDPVVLRKTVAYIVSQGFDVLLFDKRGHGFSEGQVKGRGEDIYQMLDQLESGVMAMGANDTVPPVEKTKGILGTGFTAKTKPVILLGTSMGAAIMENAMALNFGDTAVEAYFDNAGNFDEVGSAMASALISGYNIRGLIEDSGWNGSLKYLMTPEFALIESIALFGYQDHNLLSGAIQQTMGQWPGYMAIKPTLDFGTPDGTIDIFNNELRGFKRIVMTVGTHASGFLNKITTTDPHLVPTDTNAYVSTEVAKFAKQITLANSDLNNTTTTTIEKEACKAVNMEASGRIDANNMSVEKVLSDYFQIDFNQ